MARLRRPHGRAVAVCGGDDEEVRRQGGAQTEESGITEGAKVIDPASMENASGNVTVCMGKDTGGDVTAAVKAFNAQDNGVTVDLLESDVGRRAARFVVQRQEASSGECDVFSSDVIWSAEFASAEATVRPDAYVETRQDELIEATLETVNFDGKFWACRSRRTRRSSTTGPTRSRRSRRPGRRSTRWRPTWTASSTRARRTRA